MTETSGASVKEMKFTLPEMSAFLDEVFPQVRGMFRIDRMDDELLIMRLTASERHLRPGGTVSGPAMFSLADVAAYTAPSTLCANRRRARMCWSNAGS